MGRYICKTCGNSCNEDELVVKLIRSNDWYSPDEYDDPRCPECGSDDVWEAEECPICGEYYIKEDGGAICPDCEEAIMEAIDDLAKNLNKYEPQQAKDEIINFIAEKEW